MDLFLWSRLTRLRGIIKDALSIQDRVFPLNFLFCSDSRSINL